MKFFSSKSVVPLSLLFSLCLIEMGAALPLREHDSRDAVQYSKHDSSSGHQLASTLTSRGLGDVLRKATGKELTPEQKQAKIDKLDKKLNIDSHKAVSQYHHKVAKIENGGGSLRIIVNQYSGPPGDRKAAEKLAQDGWKHKMDMQQFKQVNIAVLPQKPGSRLTIVQAIYHNGLKNGFGHQVAATYTM
ncbi:hypothetical protein BJ912DRAFT_977010 [Pholiota molesta]|nr:hypothetical protein BJ912DRAFT_977010 [Pholiota molesta]